MGLKRVTFVKFSNFINVTASQNRPETRCCQQNMRYLILFLLVHGALKHEALVEQWRFSAPQSSMTTAFSNSAGETAASGSKRPCVSLIIMRHWHTVLRQNLRRLWRNHSLPSHRYPLHACMLVAYMFDYFALLNVQLLFFNTMLCCLLLLT